MNYHRRKIIRIFIQKSILGFDEPIKSIHLSVDGSCKV